MLMPIYTPFKKSVATITFAGQTVQNTSASTFTFSGHAIGSASADRKVLVAANTTGGSSDSTGVSGLTIGGTSATKAISAFSSSGRVHCELWYLNSVSSGTTADIIVTWNSSRGGGCNIGVWAITGAASGVNDTGSDTGTGDPLSTTIDCSAGGVVAATNAFEVGLVTITAATYTGLTNDYQSAANGSRGESGSATFSQGASEAFSTAQSGRTISVAKSGTVNGGSLVVASFDAA